MRADLFRSSLRMAVRGTAGYDGSLLGLRDFLVSLEDERTLVRGADGRVEARICDFKLIGRPAAARR